jgi:hypothetical protein
MCLALFIFASGAAYFIIVRIAVAMPEEAKKPGHDHHRRKSTTCKSIGIEWIAMKAPDDPFDPRTSEITPVSTAPMKSPLKMGIVHAPECAAH